jgi:hypothetical protein
MLRISKSTTKGTSHTKDFLSETCVLSALVVKENLDFFEGYAY